MQDGSNESATTRPSTGLTCERRIRFESTFATVRLRTVKTRGSGSSIACLTTLFKLVQSVQRRWRALGGSTLIPEVITGVRVVDGVQQQAT